MHASDVTINGDLLRLRRETMGWALSDMATRSCLSIKQVRQLEEGGQSAFYSDAVKATAAKKVGAILGLTPEEVFGQGLAVQALDQASEVDAAIEAADLPTHAVNSEPATLAQEDHTSTEHDLTLTDSVGAEVISSEPVTSSGIDDPVAETKSKTSLWLIVALFAAALGVAAWMQPSSEPVATEPPPPLQTLPADSAASAASEAEEPASAADLASQTPAASSAAVVVQSSLVTPVLKPAAQVASAVPAVIVKPAASTASK